MAFFETLALANIASILLAEANRTMSCPSYPVVLCLSATTTPSSHPLPDHPSLCYAKLDTDLMSLAVRLHVLTAQVPESVRGHAR